MLRNKTILLKVGLHELHCPNSIETVILVINIWNLGNQKISYFKMQWKFPLENVTRNHWFGLLYTEGESLFGPKIKPMKHENQPGENKVTLILFTFLTNNKRKKKSVFPPVLCKDIWKRTHARNNLRNSHATVTRLLSFFFFCFF